MAEDVPFKDKIKTIGVMSGQHRGDKKVTETRHPDGYRLKSTTEGDPENGTVTHTEHAVGDRVDANVSPATLSYGLGINDKGEK